MKLRVWAVLITVTLFLSFSFGHTVASITGNVAAAVDAKDEAASLKGAIVPARLRWLAGDERINANVARADNSTQVIGLVIVDGIITESRAGAVENATLEFYLREDTIRRIQRSDDALTALDDALKSGEISYNAVGIVKKAKYAAASWIVKIAFWVRSWLPW